MRHFVLLLSGWLFAAVCSAAGLDDYKDRMLPAAEAGKPAMSVMFIGVATLLFEDGETAFMTDGFFSRPAFNSLRSIRPDQDRISKALQRAGVKNLAAVIPLHSHFDHAMDSPTVAMQTGAMLVGSTSTLNIGRGASMPDARMRTVSNGETLTFGRFKVTFVLSAHLPAEFALGEIKSPLSAPAAATDYKLGDCYSLLIEHDGRTVLVQGSAGFVPGALAGRKADVVYLGIGGLETRNEGYQEDYWREMVKTVGAKRVVPIHWDNFFKPLDEPLVPSGGFDRSMRFLVTRAKNDNVDIRLPAIWVRADPFGGL